jgi:hypothetical protein
LVWVNLNVSVIDADVVAVSTPSPPRLRLTIRHIDRSRARRAIPPLLHVRVEERAGVRRLALDRFLVESPSP